MDAPSHSHGSCLQTLSTLLQSPPPPFPPFHLLPGYFFFYFIQLIKHEHLQFLIVNLKKNLSLPIFISFFLSQDEMGNSFIYILEPILTLFIYYIFPQPNLFTVLTSASKLFYITYPLKRFSLQPLYLLPSLHYATSLSP